MKKKDLFAELLANTLLEQAKRSLKIKKNVKCKYKAQNLSTNSLKVILEETPTAG